MEAYLERGHRERYTVGRFRKVRQFQKSRMVIYTKTILNLKFKIGSEFYSSRNKNSLTCLVLGLVYLIITSNGNISNDLLHSNNDDDPAADTQHTLLNAFITDLTSSDAPLRLDGNFVVIPLFI